MTDNSLCVKPILPSEPAPMTMTVEEYVRPPCIEMTPSSGPNTPISSKFRPSEEEPTMPMCPCPEPNVPPCRNDGSPTGADDCLFKP